MSWALAQAPDKSPYSCKEKVQAVLDGIALGSFPSQDHHELLAVLNSASDGLFRHTGCPCGRWKYLCLKGAGVILRWRILSFFLCVCVCLLLSSRRWGSWSCTEGWAQPHPNRDRSSEWITIWVLGDLSFHSGNVEWGTIKLSLKTRLQAGNLNGLLTWLGDHPVVRVCTVISTDPWCGTTSPTSVGIPQYLQDFLLSLSFHFLKAKNETKCQHLNLFLKQNPCLLVSLCQFYLSNSRASALCHIAWTWVMHNKSAIYSITN